MIIINIEEEPVKTKHITYYTTRYFDFGNRQEVIALHEIVECDYNHPDSQGYATISRIEDRSLLNINVNDSNSAPLHLLENALTNISLALRDQLDP
jgi:hypothetical protein